MSRSAARRTNAVQVDKSLPPESPRSPDEPLGAPNPESNVPWYWRLVLFIWGTSFASLLAYELLAGLIKAW
jgi:hypothetical protein